MEEDEELELNGKKKGEELEEDEEIPTEEDKKKAEELEESYNTLMEIAHIHESIAGSGSKLSNASMYAAQGVAKGVAKGKEAVKKGIKSFKGLSGLKKAGVVGAVAGAGILATVGIRKMVAMRKKKQEELSRTKDKYKQAELKKEIVSMKAKEEKARKTVKKEAAKAKKK